MKTSEIEVGDKVEVLESITFDHRLSIRSIPKGSLGTITHVVVNDDGNRRKADWTDIAVGRFAFILHIEWDDKDLQDRDGAFYAGAKRFKLIKRKGHE